MPSRCISCASNVETQCICTCTNQLLDEINNKKIKKNRKIAQCPVPPAVEWIFHCCLLRWQLPPTAMRRVIETGRVVEGWRGFSSKAFSYLSASPSPILLLLAPLSSLFVLLRPSPKPTIFSEVGRWRHGPTHTEAGSGGYNSLWKENRGGTEGRGCIHDSKLRNQKG